MLCRTPIWPPVVLRAVLSVAPATFTPVIELPDLRQVLRGETLPSRTTVVIRGGPDSSEKLRSHAQRTARAFALDGVPALGISVFAGLDDIGAASVDGVLAGKLATYRVVHLVEAGALLSEGFQLLPTFTRPHMTLLLTSLDDLEPLVKLLGPASPNPHYGETTGRRRR
jgi:hypothetical protein